ncbi:DNA mismatch repair protein MutS, partial [Roseomonas chloroacetimidivorans]|uniref:DNA mismatch repair protein MutS n=1 Tax=Roseomonas chloroacetimidivorans TaxID=1766656 RepID=UPI003C73447B
SLRELEISDDTLIGLLVLALAGNNVRVQSGAKGDDFMVQHRAALAASITEGGALARDPEALRSAGGCLLLASGPVPPYLERTMNTPVIPPASPMMLAHAAAAAAAPGHLIFYRVGEFYEVLGADAPVFARALGLQLTRRRQKDAADVPMCGVPAATASSAVARLLAAGHKVALSEQPPEPGAERPLRQMTPGTSVDAAVLTEGRPNNLCVALSEGDAVAFAWTDLSTGETSTAMASLNGSGAALARISPAEVLVARWPEASEALAVALRGSGVPFSNLNRAVPGLDEAKRSLLALYSDSAADLMRGFSPPELSALAALLDYVGATVGRMPEAMPLPRRAGMSDTMEIDAPTLRGLEVLSSASGREGSLLSVLDRTVTPPGARLLMRQLAAPLTDPATIARRLAMVRFLVEQPSVRSGCREALSGMPDVLRACGRLSLGQGSPRDLAAVRGFLDRVSEAATQLQHAEALPPGLLTAARDLAAGASGPCGELATALRRALVAFPPAEVEAGFVAEGYDAKLDAARLVVAEGQGAIEALQACYATKTGVKSLRIRVNTVLGHHIEVPASAAKGLGPEFVLRQGLANSSRFATTELDRLAAEHAAAAETVLRAEQRIFGALRSMTLAARPALTRIAHAAAALDLVCGLAQAAAEGLWIEPELCDDAELYIEGGRHPVAEAILESAGRSFIPNDCHMPDAQRLWLLTGPNMAGKSTFLRQVALIVLMAQVGSFVPAKRARIGKVDKLFSRIGASDDLAAGRSTFMVEMLETAAILSQATARSLVILDEVGRGTSTHDGLSIAQACMEYLHDEVGCRTLFATHYHELADAAESMSHSICMTMDAAAGRHGDVFSYKVLAGRSGRSYGLKVAALAGMPRRVLQRAEEILAQHTGHSPKAS